MSEVTGQIVKIDEKDSKNGGKYTVINLRGQSKGFYDWDDCGIKPCISNGDTVKIDYDDGNYPRVTGLEIISKGTDTGKACEYSDRDIQITRMCALKCAAQVLANSDMPYDDLVGEITGIAEKLENWIMR